MFIILFAKLISKHYLSATLISKMIELLNSLLSTGMYAKLYKAGIVNPKFATYLDMALYVDAQIKSRNITKTAAVIETAVKYDCSEPTVWNALKAVNKPL